MVIELDKFDIAADFHRVVQLAEDVSEAAVELFSLQTGWGVRVAFERVVLPNGELKWPTPRDDELPK